MPRRRPVLTAVLALGVSACHTIETQRTKEVVRVESSPPGASVQLMNEGGSRGVGQTPLDLELEVERDIFDFSPVQGWITTGVLVALTAVSTYYLVNPGTTTSEISGRETTDTGPFLLGLLGTSIFGGAALAAVPLTIAGHYQDGEALATRYVGGPPVLSAELPGHMPATANLITQAIPPEGPIRFELARKAGAPPPAGVLGALRGGVGGLGAALRARKPVIAVFDLEAKDAGFEASELRALSDYLSARVASAARYQVVPSADLRAELSKAKKGSYAACVDEACQIELGKAVAAERTLVTRLIRVGKSCALTGTIFDLRTEATHQAATVRTACDQEAVMTAIEQLSDDLAGAGD